MKPKKVLVVDDSKLLHRMFEMMLRGFPLVHAFDGREALDRTADAREILTRGQEVARRQNNTHTLSELTQALETLPPQ